MVQYSKNIYSKELLSVVKLILSKYSKYKQEPPKTRKPVSKNVKQTKTIINVPGMP